MIQVMSGDITQLGGTPYQSAAIVNAANSGLLAGGGVCGSIFRAAGTSLLQRACDEVAPCPTGESRLTPAFGLQSQGVEAIIHTVGPDCRVTPQEEADVLLELAYTSAVRCASDAGLNSIAFPSISTGIYEFPKERAAQIAIKALRSVDRQDLTITLVAFDRDTAELWEQAQNG